jgi:hypothetical protein
MGAKLNSPQLEVILFSVLGTRSSQCSSISVLGLGNSSLRRGPLYCSFSLLGALGTRRRQPVLNLPKSFAQGDEEMKGQVASTSTVATSFCVSQLLCVCVCVCVLFVLASRVSRSLAWERKPKKLKKTVFFTTLHWLLGRGWWWSWPFCELEQWCWRRRWPRARQLRCVAE